MSNSDIEQSITAKIASEPDLDAKDVKVDSDKDKANITVKGTVYSEAARTRVLAIAKSVEPNFTITDKIDVKPREVSREQYTEEMANQARETAQSAGEKVGKSLEDAWLHTKVKTKLAANSTKEATKINVDVENRVVTLRGRVDTAEAKRDAGRIASETNGVRRVNNQLVVRAS